MPRLEEVNTIQASLLEATGADQLQVSRALPYGTAASALAILLAMTQVQSRALDAQVAIVAAAFCIPLSLVSAAIYEYYLFLGGSSYEHYRSKATQRVIKRTGYSAALALVISLGALVHVLLPWATWVYALAIVLAFLGLHQFNTDLVAWWHSRETDPQAPRGA